MFTGPWRRSQDAQRSTIPSMMSPSDSRSRTITALLATFSVLVGGAFYLHSMLSPAKPKVTPLRTTRAVTQPMTSETDESSLDQRSSLAASPAILRMATQAKVSPPHQRDEAQAALAPIISSLEACYRSLQRDQPGVSGNGSIHLVVGNDGAVRKPTFQFSGTQNQRFQKCAIGKLKTATMPGVAPETSVFWPLHMAPDVGVQLRTP